MKHKLQINFKPTNNWSMSVYINNNLMVELDSIPEVFTTEFLIEEYNVVMIFFKDNEHCSKGFSILDILYNNLQVGKTLFTNSEFFSSHPNYTKCAPCTDINLTGVWFFRFNKNYGNEIIRSNVNGK